MDLPQRPASAAALNLNGARSGQKIGLKLNIAAKDAATINEANYLYPF